MEFKYLEHTADLKFQAEGTNLKHAFRNAAKAMFNAMVKINTIQPKLEKIVELTSESIESLLFDWLSKLLTLHDSYNLLFSEFQIQNINRQDSKWYLRAKIKGEKLDQKRHQPEMMIKAMTYNELKIEKKGKKFLLTVVMDI